MDHTYPGQSTGIIYNSSPIDMGAQNVECKQTACQIDE